MKILFVARYINNPRGGGERSALALIKKLSIKHDIYLISFEDQESQVENLNSHIDRLRGYSLVFHPSLTNVFLPFQLMLLINELRLYFSIKKVIKNEKFDLIILQNHMLFDYFKTPSVCFIRDFSFGDLKRLPFYKKIANFIFSIIRISNLRKINLVIANSKFLATELKEKSINSEIIYPFIDIQSYKLENVDKKEKKYITFINPTFEKGVNIALNIARNMSGYRFLFVGNSPASIVKEINKYSNIKYMNWVKDVKQIYRQSILMIVPSIIDETYGRIPIEAGINGIPSVVSNHGGLREAVGNGGVVIRNIYDLQEWIQSIKSVMSNKNYSKYSHLIKEHSMNFNLELSYKKFVKLVNEYTQIQL